MKTIIKHLILISLFLFSHIIYADLKNDFIKERDNFVKDKNWIGILSLINKFEKNQKYLNNGELELNRGKAYIELQLPLLAAKEFLSGIRKFSGTDFSIIMLKKLEQLAIKKQVYENELFILFNEGLLSDLPKSLQSFSAYYQLKKIKKNKNSKYFKNTSTKIFKSSYWWLLSLYEKAVYKYEKLPPKKALRLFTSIEKKTRKYKYLHDKVLLNISRISFELKRYDTAIRIAKKIKVKGRLLAHLNNIIAWSNYHKGDYGKTLGILQNLKSPYFQLYYNPENVLIELTIYRKLCWFQEAKEAIRKIDKRNKNFIKNIAFNYYLLNNKSILSSSLFYEPAMSQALFIEKTYQHLEIMKILNKDSNIKSLFSKNYHFIKNLNLALTERVNLDYKFLAKRASSNIFKIQEQVRLMEYLIDSDQVSRKKYRLPSASRNKKTQQLINEYKFLKWDFKEEYWSEERENYKFLVKSKCEKKERFK